MTQNGDVAVRLDGARKTYGDVVAVDRVDLDIREDEFFTLLGPSGSGKTTCLRMIAGFERPDEGRVELAGRDVTDLPPYERDVNTVFQDYALFPHMSVGENVEYGLRIAGVGQGGAPPARERGARAGPPRRLRAAPHRPALGRPAPARRARARAREPADGAAARRAARRARPQAAPADADRAAHASSGEVGITFVYVTHDQEEALTMSDRMAVFADGRIEQVGPPAEVYEHPVNEFVAGFVGVSNIVERDGKRFTIRPEKVRILDVTPRARTECAWRSGRIADVSYVGMVTRYAVELDQGGEHSGRPPEPRDVLAGGARAEGPSCARRLAWRARVRDPGLAGRNPGGGTKLTGKLTRRWLMFAALVLAIAALTAAGCGGDDDSGGGGSGSEEPGAEEGRQGRGPGEPDRLGRLRGGRLHGPEGRLGDRTSRRRPAARST